MRATRQPPFPGFTLLEMSLSVAVFLLLVTSAFSLVGATTELMTEISAVQNRASVRLRFLDSCRAAFESMNENSSLEFDYAPGRNGGTDVYLSLVDAPAAFDFGANFRDEIERVVIAAERRPDGGVRSRVYYMTAEDFEDARRSEFSEIRSPYVDLLPRMLWFEWFFYNERTGEWEVEPDGNSPTSLVRLKIQNDGDLTPLTTTFFLVN